MNEKQSKTTLLITVIVLTGFFFLYGCNFDSWLYEEHEVSKAEAQQGSHSEYYDQFYDEITKRRVFERGTTSTTALDGLPKGHGGEVNWTAAVLEGYIDPKASIEGDEPDQEPLSLNIFIEAKTPLMNNVLFPHSIHTYWLKCGNCHPKIFKMAKGQNPITMDEIFEGKWCGVCHGKVAFNFFPLANCRRCHIIMKGQSLEEENWR
ncbi:MAG: c(7)-type cytochrome triheme domain-containing protein [Thermodesulfobacteriota bacterium]